VRKVHENNGIPDLKRRELKLNAKFETGSSHFSFES
jgi:hypothetical protein